MNPGARFVSLSREVMRQHGQDPDANLDDSEVAVQWNAHEKGQKYLLKKDYIQNRSGTIFMAYVLEHYSDSYSSKRPHKRYFVAADENTDNVTTSRIFLIDHKNMPMTYNGDVAMWQRTLSRNALTILGEQAPGYADKLVTEQFDQYYSSVVADYILSDYAVEGTDHNLTTDTVQESVLSFRQRMQKISQRVIEKSKKHGPNGATPNPAYTEAVSEAVGGVREADSRNRYKVIEYGQAVLGAVKDIKQWKYHVSRTDRYKRNTLDEGTDAA